MSSKTPYILFSILIIICFIPSSLSTVLIKVGNNINYSCEKNIYYITIDVIFSEKPKKSIYPFTLNLASPENLNFKCSLDYSKSQIYCFRAFSTDDDFISKNTYLQYPYPFPEIEDIEWDYETFLQKIYRKVWVMATDCGNENLNSFDSIEKINWNIKGSIQELSNGQCIPASISDEKISKYSFNMKISFNEGDVIDLVKNAEKDENNVELMQEIWVPLLPKEESKTNTKAYQKNFSFVFCKAKDKITKENYSNFTLNCELPIKANTIFHGVIHLTTFFDKLYIKQKNAINIVSLHANVNGKPYISLSGLDAGIICPNQPLFTIDSKDNINMGEYYSASNKYTFFITGTLSNGYYVFVNGTSVALNETYKTINFNLKIEDNLIDDDDEEDLLAKCTLPSQSVFNQRNKVQIKCIGDKPKSKEQSRNDNNIDITLNWNLKVNNNFKDIMIRWPKTYDDNNKKNIYKYQLTGLSIRQSNFACHNNNFDFYVYIYNLYHEPKLSFNLPLTIPKNSYAFCEIFDPTALKCSLNLKHKKLSKGAQVMLPVRGSENEIITKEGNIILFTMNNFTKINNDHDFYVNLEEECGDYLVVGTLKDMGMSHKSSIITYIIIIVVIAIIVVGFIIYISWKIKKKIKSRGAKLTTSEENKDNTAGVRDKI